MSDLSNKFNAMWREKGQGEARQFRVFIEVRRILTGKMPHLTNKHGRRVAIDRNKYFTLWELRLAEIIADAMRDNMRDWFGKGCEHQACQWEETEETGGPDYKEAHPALILCGHADNPENTEGNCQKSQCPLKK